MLPLLLGENFNGRIYRGLVRDHPNLDIVRVQDVGLRTVDDPDILEWAAENQRVVASNDVKTMPAFAYERMEAGKPMPG